MSIEAFTNKEVTEAFTLGDCWVLALELTRRYPSLEVNILQDSETDDWVHAVAYDSGTDTYIDAAGPHTFDEIQSAWDFLEWDEIVPASAEILREMQTEMVRHHPDVPVDAAVNLIVSNGWTPPKE